VDRIVNGGEQIVLKGGGILELIDAPGHSPCGVAAWYEKDRVLFVSDALGFQISDDTIFPIFFTLTSHTSKPSNDWRNIRPISWPFPTNASGREMR
jgi:glyoxylase-like metal-dependent hydrolase (beta-lactamase superfamily II)